MSLSLLLNVSDKKVLSARYSFSGADISHNLPPAKMQAVLLYNKRDAVISVP